MSRFLSIEELILQTDASGAPVRLEYVRGHPRWEALPSSRHQKALRYIERSVRPVDAHLMGCACFTLADVLIRFPDPDRSLKRPDLAIFCTEPPDSDEAIDMTPAAVVEVLSPGYEDKDLGPDGAPFYLTYGVRDVVVFDPRRKTAVHFQAGSAPVTWQGPATVVLACGCQLEVPG
ncbi:Uma2 family endonuclease [uncultured Chloroflexus sp.]|uniref:Uma2 family endonuclease n=1 Tax=uncultured Chloroflexus sp. TaxID=214040 RepID=UPI0026276EAA|nr:Uma2 family endonuclease [uncultured Chloroflexus sp.]